MSTTVQHLHNSLFPTIIPLQDWRSVVEEYGERYRVEAQPTLSEYGIEPTRLKKRPKRKKRSRGRVEIRTRTPTTIGRIR